MKNNYFTKSVWAGVAFCAILLVACGLKITKVTLSSNEIAVGEEVTVTAQFNNPATDNWGNNTGVYLMYAIRVPSDWSASGMLEAVNNFNGTPTTYDFKESPAYAALAELCYPLEGYKWLAYQTKSAVDVNCDSDNDNVISTITLTSGNQPGDYKVDMIAGSFTKDPSYLLNSDGTINVNYAFGNNFDFSEAVMPVKYTDGGDEITMFQFSEYIVTSATLSPEELEARKFSLMDYTATVQGQTYPITPSDLANPLTDAEIAQLQLNITVTGEAEEGPGGETNAVSEIKVSENDNAPVYNLNGVKVANPTAPGVYIKNGKKFVVK